MAAILHQQFKVPWLKKQPQVELYAHRRFVQVTDEEQAVATASPSALPPPTPAADPHEYNISAFFVIFVKDRTDDLKNTWSFVTTYLTKPAGSAWKGEVLKLPFMKRLFIKCNTPLTSSAAVECLFFAGKDIHVHVLRPKRSRLEDAMFDKIMFVRANRKDLYH